MAITANVDLGNGVTASSCYIIVPTAYVKNLMMIHLNLFMMFIFMRIKLLRTRLV